MEQQAAQNEARVRMELTCLPNSHEIYQVELFSSFQVINLYLNHVTV